MWSTDRYRLQGSQATSHTLNRSAGHLHQRQYSFTGDYYAGLLMSVQESRYGTLGGAGTRDTSLYTGGGGREDTMITWTKMRHPGIHTMTGSVDQHRQQLAVSPGFTRSSRSNVWRKESVHKVRKTWDRNCLHVKATAHSTIPFSPSNQSINQSITFYSANIPGEARLSGTKKGSRNPKMLYGQWFIH